MTDATTEIILVQYVLHELQIPSPRSARLWCDNMRAKYLASNLIFYGRMKHVEVDYHFCPRSCSYEATRRQVYINRRPNC
jgi:hypothetical protein